MNGYDLSRKWFDFAFENQDLVSGNHASVYLWHVELANRMGWVDKFASPTSQGMAATGIKSYNTYNKCLKDIVEWGFITVIKQSLNQYQSSIIALSKNDTSLNGSLDKAIMNHVLIQDDDTAIDTNKDSVEITDSINKQINNKPQTSKQLDKSGKIDFYVFWNAYGKKVGSIEKKLEPKWYGFSRDQQDLIMAYIPKHLIDTPEVKFRPHPFTFLNSEVWMNDIIELKSKVSEVELSPEILKERQIRKSHQDAYYMGAEYARGKPIKFNERMSIYHEQIGFYDQLRQQ